MFRRSLCLSLFAVVLFAHALAGATFVVPADRDLIKQADAIVYARAVEATSRFNAAGRIETITTLEVDLSLKGSVASGGRITVTELGGFVGEVGFIVPGSPAFEAGESTLLFLEKRADGFATASMALGKFDRVPDSSGETLLVRGTEDGGEIFGFSPDGEMHEERWRYENGFKRYIADVVAGRDSAADYFTAPQSKLLASSERGVNSFGPSAYTRLVDPDGTGSKPTLGVRWKKFDDGVSVPVKYTGQIVGAAGDGATAVQQAIDVWNNNPDSNVNFAYGGSPGGTGGLVSSDSINSVLFEDPNSEVSGTFPTSSTLGIGGFWISTTTHTHLGETFYTIIQGDVILNNGYSGSGNAGLTNGGLAVLIAHELGHSLGFRHSNRTGAGEGAADPQDSSAVMRFSWSFSSPGASYTNGSAVFLQDWDQLAVSTVYGDGPGCISPSVTDHPNSTTINSGDSARLIVEYTGTTPVTVQWYQGSSGDTSTPIGAAAENGIFDTPPLTEDTKFWARVSNSCGFADSNAALVSICRVPEITTQPKSQTVEAGKSVSLSVSHLGTTPMTYKWYRGDSGNTASQVGTSRTLSIVPNAPSDKFWVRVKNDCGTVDSTTATITVVSGCEPIVINAQPSSVTVPSGSPVVLTIDHSGTGVQYFWFRGTAPDTSQLVGTDSSLTIPAVTESANYWVRLKNDCSQVDSFTITVTVSGACAAPSIIAGPPSTTVGYGHTKTLAVLVNGTEPFSYQWYRGTAPDTSNLVGTDPTYTTPPLLADAQYWVRVSNDCGVATSQTAVLTSVCVAPPVPNIALSPGLINQGQRYRIGWPEVPGSSTFVLEEYKNVRGASPVKLAEITTTERTHLLTQPLSGPLSEDTTLVYRVKAISDCDGNPQSDFSKLVAITILIPKPSTEGVTSVEDPQPVTFEVVLRSPEAAGKGLGVMNSSVSLATDVPWGTVSPSTATIPPGGSTTVTVTLNPQTLPPGTNTGTLVVTTTAGPPVPSVPVSVSLVTPVTPTAKTTPPENALIITSVAHSPGVNGSQWRSDIRLTNTATETIEYQLTYTPSGMDGTVVGNQTIISVAGDQTMALNDIIKNWYGLGVTDAGSIGVLEIRPLNFAGKGLTPHTTLATVASSRTYNEPSVTSATAATGGTYGQFVPALPFADFVGKTTDQAQPNVLSLQQVSESADYRTNLGLIEASGAPADGVIRVYDKTGGAPIATFPFHLDAGQHIQKNKYLVTEGRNVPLVDGRIEVEVTSETGRVLAYAGITDNRTGDPYLVSPALLREAGAERYVVPGVAKIDNGFADWRSDVHVFNPGSASADVTLTFHPTQLLSPSRSASITIAAGEVRVLGDVLGSTFQLNNVSGALHVTAADGAPLVVTNHTYDLKKPSETLPAGGTVGLYMDAVTPDKAVGLGDRALQVLQLEQSDRFRTNLGVVEVSGNDAVVELTAYVPGQLSDVKFTWPLKANEFIQFGHVLKDWFHISTAYNARIAVKVISGEGRVAAYGSVIDMATQDPTLVPSQ